MNRLQDGHLQSAPLTMIGRYRPRIDEVIAIHYDGTQPTADRVRRLLSAANPGLVSYVDTDHVIHLRPVDRPDDAIHPGNVVTRSPSGGRWSVFTKDEFDDRFEPLRAFCPTFDDGEVS